MHKNKIKRIFMIIILMFTICVSKAVFADNYDLSGYEKNDSNGTAVTFVQKAMSTGLKVVRIVAAGVAVIGLILIGIKYINASPEGRATYKKTFLIFFLGIVLVISGTAIIEMISTAAGDMFKQ